MRNTALALIFLSLAACGAERRSLRHEKKEIQQLGEVSGMYWHYMRWAHYGRAAVFYLDPTYRADWMNEMVSAPPYKYSAADILRVEVSPEFEEPEEGVLREGRVFIQAQGYRLPDQVMEQTMITQNWNRYEGGWFIDTEEDEGSDEPDAE